MSDQSVWMLDSMPTTFDDLRAIRPNLTYRFDQYLQSQTMPHLLLVGREGAGKGTLARLFAREMVRDTSNLLTLYADDPPTKDDRDEAHRLGTTSKNKVGHRAGSVRSLSPFLHIHVLPFVMNRRFGADPFKILIIKNFDQLGMEQEAFRRIMEQYSENCRMILMTNNLPHIIDPILSRCSIIFVPKLEDDAFDAILTEKIQNYLPTFTDDDAVQCLRTVTNSNLGKSLQLAQIVYDRHNLISRRMILPYAENKTETQIYAILRLLFQKQISNAITKLNETLRYTPIDIQEFLRYAVTYIFQNKMIATSVRSALIHSIAALDEDATSVSEHLLFLQHVLFTLYTQFLKVTS